MKQKMKKVICMAVIGALALTSAVGGNVTSQAAAKTKKIVMNKKKVTVKVGKTFKLKVKKVTPAKASKAVTYKTKNKKIATVTKKGVIKGKKVGKTTITVTSKKNKKATAKVTVTVKKADKKTVTTPTPVPSSTPVASASVSASPAASAPAGVPGETTPAATTPATSAPITTAPAASAPTTPKESTSPKPPKTAPPTKAPAVVDKEGDEVVGLEFGKDNILQDALWTNDFYERTDNEDGSVTLVRGQGDQSWQVGEFGFVIPRDIVGNDHKLTKIIIKYKDSDLTGTEVDKTTDTCGYVFHLGDTDQVSWIEGENQGTDPDLPDSHPYSLLFNGAGETAIVAEEHETNFSTVRIFDGKIGGKITIESIKLEKAEIAAPDTPNVDTPNADTPNADTPSAETGTQKQAPASENDGNVLKELWANTYFIRKSLSNLMNLI